MLPSRITLKLIELYQGTLRSSFGGRCRFYPSCSEYARRAYAKYPFLRASQKAIFRLIKCHPFHPGGVDEP